jgi:hypothetical protein
MSERKPVRKMSGMRARPTIRRAEGPFLLPARVVLLISGLIAVALGSFTLVHDFHAGQVNLTYTVLALVVGLVWVACIGLAFIGSRFGVFGAGAIAFVQFGVLASTHFVSGPGALGTFVKHEGLPVATVAMALVPACALTVMCAGVSWTNPRARNPRLETVALLVASVIGAALVILQATDGVHRIDFGKANIEDGAFAAAIVASIWLAGGLWIARVRRTGALLIALATFIVGYSFVTLHLVRGGTTVSEIGSTSGAIWAWISAAATVLAAASFVLAVGLLVLSLVRPARAIRSGAGQPIRRGA